MPNVSNNRIAGVIAEVSAEALAPAVCYTLALLTVVITLLHISTIGF